MWNGGIKRDNKVDEKKELTYKVYEKKKREKKSRYKSSIGV